MRILLAVLLVFCLFAISSVASAQYIPAYQQAAYGPSVNVGVHPGPQIGLLGRLRLAKALKLRARADSWDAFNSRLYGGAGYSQVGYGGYGAQYGGGYALPSFGALGLATHVQQMQIPIQTQQVMWQIPQIAYQLVQVAAPQTVQIPLMAQLQIPQLQLQMVPTGGCVGGNGGVQQQPTPDPVDVPVQQGTTL